MEFIHIRDIPWQHSRLQNIEFIPLRREMKVPGAMTLCIRYRGDDWNIGLPCRFNCGQGGETC